MFGLCTIDIIILILLLLGSLFGFKKGIIKSIISLALMILAIIIAWFLKNPIASIMYTKLPFFSFTNSTSIINIIIYEMIAFLVIAIILLILVRVILIFTGLVDKILSITKSMGFTSKLLGLAFGFIEMYVFIFIILFVTYNFTNVYKTIDESTVAIRMLSSTPILSPMVDSERATFDEIYNLKNDYKEDDEEYNKKVFETLIKYKVISTNTAKELVKEEKIKIAGSEEIIKRYE